MLSRLAERCRRRSRRKTILLLPRMEQQYEAWNEARQPKTTSIIDDYEISNHVLGLGINGKVVQCYDRRNRDKYALKVKVLNIYFCVCCLFVYFGDEKNKNIGVYEFCFKFSSDVFRVVRIICSLYAVSFISVSIACCFAFFFSSYTDLWFYHMERFRAYHDATLCPREEIKNKAKF